MSAKKPPGGDDDDERQPKKSRAQWQSYVEGLTVEALGEAAEHANSAAFVAAMQAEGYDGDEVHHVLVAFALRFKKLGMLPPPGGYVDLEWLADNPS